MPTVNECHKLHKEAEHEARMTKHLYQATLAHFDTTLTNLEKGSNTELPKLAKKEGHRLTGLVRFLQSSSCEKGLVADTTSGF